MFIVWPDEDRKTVIKQAVFAKNGFPGVIGCIDCTHIRIQAPRVDENDFVNGKGYHSLNVQAICDDKGEYTVGYWGQRVPIICFVCENHNYITLFTIILGMFTNVVAK